MTPQLVSWNRSLSFPAPSGLIGIESLLRNVERYAGHLAGIALFDPVLREEYLNLEREPGAGEANHDIAVRIRVLAKAVAPGARRWGEAAG